MSANEKEVAENSPEIMLVRYEAAEQALVQANSVIEVKNIRDQAEALRTCAKLAGFSLEWQNRFALLKLCAERLAGEMLNEVVPATGGRPRKNLVSESKFSAPQTLASLGITYTQSRRWRKEASVPEEVFKLYVAAINSAGDELTSAGVLRLADQLQQHEKAYSDDFDVPPKSAGKHKTNQKPLLYQDSWLRVWDAEAETDEPYVLTDNTVAVVVSDGVRTHYYFLEAVQGFILAPIKK